jgi:TrmH family RNA methyltransferase
MITSLSNDRVRYIRALQTRRRVRQREQHFALEGIRLVEEAVRAGAAPAFIFHTEDILVGERGRALLASLRAMAVPCHVVTPSVLQACADTEHPQPILAVVPIPHLAPPPDLKLMLVVDRVRDPGNLGTMLRTAYAAGVEHMLLTPGTVDATNPKVVRAAMGAHLHLPISTRGWDAIAEAVDNTDVWLATAAGQLDYTDVDWTRPATLFVGGEAFGESARARALAQGQVSIPMVKGVDSLNTAVATAVILFEVRRQRNLPG